MLQHITVETLATIQHSVYVIDVRTAEEYTLCHLDGSHNIPLNTLPQNSHTLPDDLPLVVLCHHGVRSIQAGEWLVAQGFDNVSNVIGGIEAWSLKIDPNVKRY